MASKTSSSGITGTRSLFPVPETKERELRRLMRSMKKVLVAFSGGVDSSYLAFIANDELKENAHAVLGVSPSVSEMQRAEAREFAERHALNFMEVETRELEDQNYISNPSDRCFYCKSELYDKLTALAGKTSITNIIDGTNADDLQDVRPGRKAAIDRGVRSPLAELGISKSDIRQLSLKHELVTWDKPSSPCLSSRIAYGVPVTRQRLSQVEKAEAYIRELGFREFRVRVHGEIARIEISKHEMGRFLQPESFESVNSAIRELGFKHVTLDLSGFRSGSLN